MAVVKPALQLRLGQQLTMTPQLQKAIRLLQLSAQDLQHEMEAMLESNALLEVDETASSQEQSAGTLVDSPTSEETWEESPYTSWTKSSRSNDEDAVDTSLESVLCQDSNLQDYLTWQMQLTEFSDQERDIANFLIDSIDENGFIQNSFSELSDTIQKQLKTSQQAILTVLKRIQTFDPIGVAARDLQECLTLQLAQFPSDTPHIALAKSMLTSCWAQLAKRDKQALQKQLKQSEADLSAAMALIQSLHPRPGTQIGSKAPAYTMPDVTATYYNKRWQVALNPLSTPNLRISTLYKSKLSKQNARDQSYIKQQLQEAQWFLHSIAHRNQTLLAVSQYLVNYQAAFLSLGDEALKPLDLAQVAKALNIHESTVSRITMHKTMDTPRGLLELKAFFSNPMNMAQGGSCSASAVRALLKKVIATEDPKKPFSDSKLTQLLQAQGVNVARRTVAKYREALCISAAHERKQVF